MARGKNRAGGEPGWRAVGGSRSAPSLDGEGQNRTADTTIFSRVLYQLSYLARADKATQIKGEPDCSASFRATVEHETLHPEPVAALGRRPPCERGQVLNDARARA